MEYKKYKGRHLRHFAAGPFIWMMIVPLVILDIFMEIYHRVCFPLYGLPYVKRKDHIVISRQKLAYLKWNDKLFCAYCSYANGLMHYASAIAAATEKYWCGIKEKAHPGYLPPSHHDSFMKYGDERAFEKCKK